MEYMHIRQIHFIIKNITHHENDQEIKESAEMSYKISHVLEKD